MYLKLSVIVLSLYIPDMSLISCLSVDKVTGCEFCIVQPKNFARMTTSLKAKMDINDGQTNEHKQL